MSVVGLDFDGTVASYDDLLHRLACERRLIDAACPVSKQVVRARVRRLPRGGVEWQRLRGLAHGPRMLEASLIDGVASFLSACRARAIPVCIVSHRTEYASHDPTRTPLRPMALRWMERQGFFAPERFGIARDAVHFAATRGEKVERIRALGCTHFVDDLDETFREADFPGEVDRTLYAPLGRESSVPGVQSFRSWKDIAQKRFGWNV